MSVTVNHALQYAPITLGVKQNVYPVSRFVGQATVTGDGSGGVASFVYYLSDVSASPMDQNHHFVITEMGVVVVNTGVAYKAYLGLAAAAITTRFEGQADAIDKIAWQSALVDDGINCSITVRDPMYVGHPVDNASDCYVTLYVTTNTNTKVYTSYIRGYKYAGYPMIKRDSHWI